MLNPVLTSPFLFDQPVGRQLYVIRLVVQPRNGICDTLDWPVRNHYF